MFDWHVDLGHVLTGLGLVVAWYAMHKQQTRAQILRDQKIDIVLFGTDGQPGLVKRVERVEHEVTEPGGALHRLKNTVQAILVALAGKDIRIDPH